MKGKVIAIVAVGALTAPLALLFAFGGDEAEEEEVGGGNLEVKQIPAEYRIWVEKAGNTCPLITAPVIAAQIEAESNWNPKAVSRVGAQGIAQFMPGTWKEVGMDAASKNGDAKPDGVADPFTPGDAIMSQAKYDCGLAEGVRKRLKDKTIKGDTLELTLAAYNAGLGAVQVNGGIPPFPETQTYVKRILGLVSQFTSGGGGGAKSSGFGGRVVDQAMKWVKRETPYSWGGGGIDGPSVGFAQGAGVKGFDCSSLVQYAVYHASKGKLALPRTSQQQVKKGESVQASDMKPGDVIAFALNSPGNFDHVGIYMGNNKMVHAPRTGKNIMVSDIDDPYYASKQKETRRFG